MSNEIFETPRRRKMTADYYSDRRYKYSTIDSRMSRDSKVSRGTITPTQNLKTGATLRRSDKTG
jgi:hypothetical protein